MISLIDWDYLSSLKSGDAQNVLIDMDFMCFGTVKSYAQNSLQVWQNSVCIGRRETALVGALA